MAKDPAMLLYTADFLVGVAFMSMHERGQYITLICLQHQKGHMDISCMEAAVGNLSSTVLSHFKQDEDGLYYNERAEEEALKRRAYSESRRQNRSNPNKSSSHDLHMKNICNTYEEHMENENVNEDVNKNKDTDSSKNSNDNEKGRASRFTPPDFSEVQAYCQERGKGVDPERWFNYYTANGWMVGKNKMKDWKAAVRTWEGGQKKQGGGMNGKHERIGEHLI